MYSAKRDRQAVYIIENHMHVRQAFVVCSDGGFTVIEFTDGSQTCLRNSRLYSTREQAEEELARQEYHVMNMQSKAVRRAPAKRNQIARSLLGPYAFPH